MADYQVGFWNLENLFAPEDFPSREPWIAKAVAKDLAGWTQALFDAKIAQLASIIAALNGGAGPDILGVCEVENRYVLDQLTGALNARLAARRYDVVHADSTADHRGIDTAFLYDDRQFSVDPAAVFSHFVMRRTGTRDITQVTFTTPGGHELVAFANHWPSRSGGPVEESAGFRAVAGETLAYWHERVREIRGSDMAIIALGDLNDQPWDASVRFNANTSRERGDTSRAESARFHNLAWNYLDVDAVDHKGNPRPIDGTCTTRTMATYSTKYSSTGHCSTVNGGSRCSTTPAPSPQCQRWSTTPWAKDPSDSGCPKATQPQTSTRTATATTSRSPSQSASRTRAGACTTRVKGTASLPTKVQDATRKRIVGCRSFPD